MFFKLLILDIKKDISLSFSDNLKRRLENQRCKEYITTLYKSIKDDVYELEINKSRFITLLYRVKSIDEVKNKLNYVKDLYKDATHYCYAYIIDDNKKSSDDGEPGGTAGVPIMEVLLKNDLNFILCVVVRYFGGIKLGAGGLVRAYSNSIVEALKLTSNIELIEGYLIELEFSYDQVKLVDYILNDKNIVNKEYNDNIVYKFYLCKDELSFVPELEKA